MTQPSLTDPSVPKFYQNQLLELVTRIWLPHLRRPYILRIYIQQKPTKHLRPFGPNRLVQILHCSDLSYHPKYLKANLLQILELSIVSVYSSHHIGLWVSTDSTHSSRQMNKPLWSSIYYQTLHHQIQYQLFNLQLHHYLQLRKYYLDLLLLIHSGIFKTPPCSSSLLQQNPHLHSLALK